MSTPSPGRTVVVVGAAGGCGTSLLAGALALWWRREGRAAWLVELDLGRGDLSDAWDLPGGPSLADLVAVIDEIAPAHLRAAARPHDSGASVVVAPGEPGTEASWDGAACARLADAAREAAGSDGRCVIDAGCGLPPAARGAAARAEGVLVVCPPTIAGARRARRLFDALATGGDDARSALVLARGVGRPEIGARPLTRLVRAPVVGDLPWSPREAAELSAGRWPRRRRRGLVAAVTSLAAAVG